MSDISAADLRVTSDHPDQLASPRVTVQTSNSTDAEITATVLTAVDAQLDNAIELLGHLVAIPSMGGTDAEAANERIRNATNRKTDDTANTLFDFIFSGAFEKYPKLKLLLSESEVGWAPFMLQQWDYYWDRFRRTDNLAIKRAPSEIFAEHIYCTFLEDFVGTRAFSWWGEKNCVWSSDYPHFNMSYPHSRENVEKHLRGLPDARRRRLVRDNAVELFGLPI